MADMHCQADTLQILMKTILLNKRNIVWLHSLQGMLKVSLEDCDPLPPTSMLNHCVECWASRRRMSLLYMCFSSICSKHQVCQGQSKGVSVDDRCHILSNLHAPNGPILCSAERAPSSLIGHPAPPAPTRDAGWPDASRPGVAGLM
jgi:hypothetical protein